MGEWYPGAYKVPIGGNGNKIQLFPADNVFHIAASNWNIDTEDPFNRTRGIPGWVALERSCQTYNDQFGAMQQYCSLAEAVNGTKDGNYRNRTHEAWNPEGLTGTEEQYNSSLYTSEQCERFSDFLAWDHNENGALLQDMKNSLRLSHGVGVHRYGIDPWRISGGESWTKNYGKICPGTARMNQLGGIIERAKVIAAAVKEGKCDYLPVGRVNLPYALARTGGNSNPPTILPPISEDEDMAMVVRRNNGVDYMWTPFLGPSSLFRTILSEDDYKLYYYAGLIKEAHTTAPGANFDIIQWIQGQVKATGGDWDKDHPLS